RIRSHAVLEKADVAIVEVGGTVGDIESLPFLEAIRQFRNEVGRENVAFVHVALTPFIGPTGELKTKPTQHSVRELRSIGIQPDVIICRSDRPIASSMKEKISLLCDVEQQAVISAPDAPSIYEVPISFHKEGLDQYLAGILRLPDARPDLSEWLSVVDRVHAATDPVDVAVVGKYVHLRDAYLSVLEALQHAGFVHGVDVRVEWVPSDELADHDVAARLGGMDAVLVPGGFGWRGIEGKLDAIRFAREERVPYLGLCLGLQCAVIEFARNVCGLEGANSSEFDPETPHPVIDLLPEQQGVVDMGATMRLGSYPAELVEGTRARAIYGEPVVHERHRHRWEVNPDYHEILSRGGLVFSGLSPDGRLVEIIELSDHPFFVAGQFHPELKSRPTRAHPLFSAFVAAARDRRRERSATERLVSSG
ncbi:MAG TPA: CTP synthase, partial [Actinomycetota bacterium]|nr:CTP synthase [Actinomycetota bacterium]